MVENQAVDRDQIKAKIQDWGTNYLDQWDTLTEYLNEDNYKVRTADQNGLTVIVTKMKVPGLTAEKLQPYFDSPEAVLVAMNNRMEVTKVEDQRGNSTYHFMNELPTMATYNRSTFVTRYMTKDEATGSVQMMLCSEGNDHLHAQYVDAVGSNVQSNLVGNYSKLVPVDGGYEIEQVTCFDLAGWIPAFILTVQIGRTSESVRHIFNYLMTGERPEPAF